MKTREVLIYTYDELSDKAKSRARDWYREGDDFRPDYILEDAATIAGILGIDFQQMPVKLMNNTTRYEPKIYYELGRPGAGCVFEGRWQHAEGIIERLKAHAPNDEELAQVAATLANHPGMAVLTFFRYHGPNGLPSMVFEDVSETEDNGTSEAFEEVSKALKAFARWIYERLEEESEYQSSDEAVAENILGNEYEFFENGGRA